MAYKKQMDVEKEEKIGELTGFQDNIKDQELAKGYIYSSIGQNIGHPKIEF
jgi:hypothetical protein